MTDERRLLLELLALLDQAENCSVCVGPSDAFDGKHAEAYTTIRRRLRRMDERKPN